MKRNRGFPFDEDESGAWSSLAARHPDIAARLRQRPATWARKRRPSSQDATDDFGDAFGFDRFPFDDIPPEFRDSFPSHWGRRFEEPQAHQTHQAHQAHPAQQPHTQQQPAQAPPAPTSPQPQQTSAATQTEAGPSPHLPQYGLRNTVDLGQKSAADPSVDADDRAQRSMSAPPDARPPPNMSANEQPEPQPHPQQQQQQQQQAGNVRHIPIFVEGRDEPVINKNVDHGAHFGETKPQPHYAPPPHVDRDQYFADDSPAFHHPPNFSRAFGTPFNKGFRQGPQPFTQQKAYPQNAYRGASPQRSHSPKRPPQEEQFAKTHHPQQQAPPPQQHQQHPQQHQQHHQHPQQHQQQHPQQQQPPPHAPSPPPKQQPTPNDPITLILGIQTDVLNLMSEVENFTGAKNDKQYLYLDEMLTRNLIKLDNIETDGKENIRLARKEAIKCIQKCIAVLEAKAESNSNAAAAAAPAPAQDVDMQAAAGDQPNGEVEMKEDTKEEAKADTQDTKEQEQKPQEPQTEEAKPEEAKPGEAKPEESKEVPPPDTRPEENRAVLVEKKEQDAEKKSPKKKVVKKRDKSKDTTTKENEKKEEKLESMQVDEKGDQDSQKMEVDAAASQ
ncbi:BAG domain-containing protein Samui-like isoform X2 [Cydia pomonella]|uniref:BAG domain-containing protein Samui-like isoform X2 n=1 Tax=Cydia pomonella TaxID=82600 RepID=UPI002ADE4AE5|nr:BAG domain-containing protein Samui-like isoform X2 [Cydia pomonella]